MRRRPGVATLAAGLVFGGILSGLLIGGAVVFHLWRIEEKRSELLMRQAAGSLRLALDEQLMQLEAELATVSRYATRGGGATDFPQRVAALVRRDREVGYGWVAVYDGGGRMLAKVPDGAETSPGAAAAQDAALADRVAVSDIFASAFLQGGAVAISLPARTGDGERYIVQMAVPVARFDAVLKDVELPAEWVALLVDGNGARVTTTPGAASLAAAVSGARNGGLPVNAALASSRLSRWKIGVGVPRSFAEAPLRRTMTELAVAGSVLTLLGAFISFRVHRSIARSLGCLSRAAVALGAGEPPLAPTAGFREVTEIAGSLEQAAIRLRAAEEQRDRALQSIQAANATLEQRVEARTADLVAANRRLDEEMQGRIRAEEELGHKRRVEAVGRLTAAVAHDFNNILTPIIGNLDRLCARLPDEKSAAIARGALSAAERAAKLTDQLLAFGGKQPLSVETLGLNALIRKAEPLIGDAAGPFVSLSLRLAEGDWPVCVDRVQLELAIFNLVMNARDAMPGGGAILIGTAWLAAGDDHPGLPPGEWAVIDVSDTGEGMEPEVASRAMEPFFTTKDPEQGRGLGLSIVYGLVKRLGGECRISSERNKGTTVRLYLPRAKSAASPDEEHPFAPAADGLPAGLRVLVADDNPAVAAFVTSVLEEAGCRVSTAADGGAAVRLFGDGSAYDLAILDFAMPVMSGAAAARIMLEKKKRLPTLLVTGFADTGGLQGWPGDRILPKPFAAHALIEKLGQLLATERAGHDARR